MFNNLLGDIDATWIIIIVIIFLLLAENDDDCGEGGLGFLDNIFEGNMIIIILLIVLLFIDL